MSIFTFLQLQLFTSVPQQANALERFCSDVVLGAGRGRIFHAAKTFATQTNANREKNTMKFLFSDRLKTFPIASNCQKF